MRCGRQSIHRAESEDRTRFDVGRRSCGLRPSQLDHIRQDLEQDENALFEFKRKNDLPSTSINEVSNMLRIEMQELDTALTHVRTRKEELAARHEELVKVPVDSPDQLPASELLASQFLQGLRTQYQDGNEERLSLLAEGKGENRFPS